LMEEHTAPPGMAQEPLRKGLGKAAIEGF
jgi:hypothetical protein